MELVYLWVEDYKNIKKQGFNFSPRFKCEYDEDSNELTIDENKDYVSIFPENINITAIVGENGSGKSTLLELISILKLELKSTFLKKRNILLVYEENSIIYPITGYGSIHDYIFLNSENIINFTRFSIANEKHKYNDLFILNYFNNGLPDFSDQNEKYNILKAQKYDQFYNGHYIRKREIQEKFKIHEQYDKYTECIKSSEDIFNYFTGNLLFNSFQIILTFKNEPIGAILEDDLKEKFEQLNIEQSFMDITSLGDYRETHDKDGKYNYKYKKKIKEDKFYEYIAIYFLDTIITMYRSIFDYKLKNYKKIYLERFFSTLEKKLKDKELSSNRKNRIILDACIEEVKSFKKEICKITLAENIKYLKREFIEYYYSEVKILIHYQLLYKIYDNNFKFKDKQIYTSEIFKVSSSQITKTQNKIMQSNLFKRLYKNDVIKFYYFNYKTSQDYSLLSTGEKQFFNFFVNFTYTAVISTDSDIKHFVVMLDEIETSLHPNWQKTLVMYLNKAIENIREMKFDIRTHFIITSHSSFILSDLPKENVIFLEKGKQVYPFEDNQQTFGANIHTLLSHGFFMKDGLMGEFAKDKINDVIKVLNSKRKVSKKNQKYYKHLISIIGEPFLKEKLFKMYDEKFKISKEERIKKLKKELAELEK